MLNFNALQIEQHGNGFHITLRCHASTQAAIDGMNDANTGSALAAVAQALDAAAAMVPGGRKLQAAQVPEPPKSEPAPSPAPEASPAQVPVEGARRRRRSSGPVPSDPAVAATDTTEPVPVPAERRRRRVVEQPTPAEQAPPAEVPKATPAITDLDLVKACSIAAAQIKPAGVQEVLATFGVAKVNELAGAKRQEFLDKLKARVDTTLAR